MDLRTHYPYSLLRYGLIQAYPSLKKNIKTNVAIIGAGITGALMAYHLQKAGVKCVVVDKRNVAMGSTAASTSLIQYEIDTPLHQLIKMVGEKNAVRAYQLCRQAIYDLKNICNEIGDEDNFEAKSSLQFASFTKDVEGLEKEYELRKRLGFKVDFLNKADVKKQFGFYAPAALLSYEAAQVDAYHLTHKIFQWLDKDQCEIYDHTNIVSVQHEKRRITLTTEDGCTIESKYLVIAAGYESGKYLNKKLEDLRCTYAIISEPLPQKELWKENCLIWETADPYLYLRTTKDHRVIIGGKDTDYFKIQKQLSILSKKANALQKSFEKLFPGINIKIDFQWAGAFAATKDGLPFIGRAHLPGTFFALGYGGNGITFSLIAAQLISRIINEKTDQDLSLFSFDR